MQPCVQHSQSSDTHSERSGTSASRRRSQTGRHCRSQTGRGGQTGRHSIDVDMKTLWRRRALWTNNVSRPLIRRRTGLSVRVERRALAVGAIVAAIAHEFSKEEVHRREGAFIGRLRAHRLLGNEAQEHIRHGRPPWQRKIPKISIAWRPPWQRKIPKISVATKPGEHELTLSFGCSLATSIVYEQRSAFDRP